MLIILLLIFTNINANDFYIDSYKKLYFVDGDSINFNNLKMRIYGIDAPEFNQPCTSKDNVIINCGDLAKNHLLYLLKNVNGRVKISIIDKDVYNRSIITIYKGNKDIAELMVKNGMAYAISNKYKKSESYAKYNKIGFWNYYKPPLLPKKWRKKNNINTNNFIVK